MDQAGKTEKTVICPWCGSTMEDAISDVERVKFYICKNCKAESPKCSTADEAYKTASATAIGAQQVKDRAEIFNLRAERDHFRNEMNNAKGQASAYSDCVKVAIAEAIKAAIQSV